MGPSRTRWARPRAGGARRRPTCRRRPCRPDAPPRLSLSMAARPNPVVVPTGAREARLTVDLVGQAPKSLPVDVSVTAPAGWTADVGSGDEGAAVLHSDGVPASATAPVTLRLPAGLGGGPRGGRHRHGTRCRSRDAHRARSGPRGPSLRRRRTGMRRGPGAGPQPRRHGDRRRTERGQLRRLGYDAALLPTPGPWVHDGTTHAAPVTSGTTPNFVEGRGQTLLVQAGSRSTIHLVGSTHNGDVGTALRLTYTDGSVQSVPVALTDWAAGSGHNGNTVAIAMDHRIKGGAGVDGPPVQPSTIRSSRSGTGPTAACVARWSRSSRPASPIRPCGHCPEEWAPPSSGATHVDVLTGIAPVRAPASHVR